MSASVSHCVFFYFSWHLSYLPHIFKFMPQSPFKSAESLSHNFGFAHVDASSICAVGLWGRVGRGSAQTLACVGISLPYRCSVAEVTWFGTHTSWTQVIFTGLPQFAVLVTDSCNVGADGA